MNYKTELHCHSAGVSACARIKPAEIVEKYVAAGYSTVVLTNHLSFVTFSPDYYHGSFDWQDKMDYYLDGYYRLKEAAGDRLHILLGAEARIYEHEAADYLIYGATEDFLRTHPFLLDTDFSAFSRCVRAAGLFLVQAHPFRDHMVVTEPKELDAIEVYNGNEHCSSRNDMAEIWADRLHIKKTSGSDLHRPTDTACAGIRTEAPITTNEELLSVLRSGNYTLIKEGANLRGD